VRERERIERERGMEFCVSLGSLKKQSLEIAARHGSKV